MGHAFYNFGFLLIACFGPPVFVSSLSVQNLFPQHKGLITAALVGCFDASSAVFIGLGALNNMGIAISTVFFGYALVPLTIAMLGLVLLPSSPVPVDSDLADSTQNSSIRQVTPDPPVHYRDHPLKEQISSHMYWMLLQTVSINMIMLNFFIATVNSQVETVDPVNGVDIAKRFALMLPLGGIVFIPLVGKITDRLGPHGGLFVLWILLLVFQALHALYQVTGLPLAAYAAFAVFALCRPLFYTLGASFTGLMFGFQTFGTVYGLLFSLAGLANLAVQPLRWIAEEYGFEVSNCILLCLQLTTLLLPIKSGATRLCRRTHDQVFRQGSLLTSPELLATIAHSPNARVIRRHSSDTRSDVSIRSLS